MPDAAAPRRGEPVPSVSNHKRVLGTLQFAAVAYFLTAGGPFGIEPAVLHAGPFPCLLAFVILPFIWSLPQALITAEMASLIPDNGGYILWATDAFGDFSGWIIGVNGLVSNILDLTLYPILFADYAVNNFMSPENTSHLTTLMLRGLVIIVGFVVNARGMNDLSIISIVVTIAVMLPFVISFFAQFKDVVGGLWSGYAGQTAIVADWNGFLATIMWSYTGWDSLGCLAGEVKDPRTTFINGTLVTMLLVTVTFALPLIVSIATHPDYWTWNSGAFTRFPSDVAPWLGVFCTVAALCAHASVFNASLSTSSRALWALAGGDGASDMPVRHVPAFFAYEWKATGAPMVAVAAHAFLVILLSLLPFDMLVKAQVLLASVRILIEVAAFLWLRRKHPPASRHPDNYVLPFGWWGAIAIAVPQVIVVCIIMGIAEPIVWTIGLSVNAFGVLIFGVRTLYDRRIYGRWWPRGHCNLGNEQTPRRRQWWAAIQQGSRHSGSPGGGYDYNYRPALASGSGGGAVDGGAHSLDVSSGSESLSDNDSERGHASSSSTRSGAASGGGSGRGCAQGGSTTTTTGTTGAGHHDDNEDDANASGQDSGDELLRQRTRRRQGADGLLPA